MKASETGNDRENFGSRSPASLFTSRFSDFESFEDAFRALDVAFRQLDCGPFNANLICVETPSVVLSECDLNRKIEQHEVSQNGFRTFGFAAEEDFDVRWRNKDVGPQNVMVFEGGKEIHSVSKPGFHVFAVAVTEARLQEAAERRGVASIDEVLPTSDVMESTKPGSLHLRRLASRIVRSAIHHPEVLNNQFFLESIEFDLVESLIDEIAWSQGGEPRPMAHSRNRILRKALHIIEEQVGEPVRVADLERLTGASSRTLRNVFVEQFDVSPKRYLLAYRLNKVRRRLLKERPEHGKISEVANEWGFWHMGEFASHYRRYFGELPSQTLAKSR